MATVTVTTENIDQLIAESAILILDFWADWCGPCRAFAPTFEAASEAHPDVVFGKVDTMDQQALAQAFGVQGIPNLTVFKEQIGVFQQAGALPPPAFEELITQVKGLDMDEVRKQIAAHEAEQADAE